MKLLIVFTLIAALLSCPAITYAQPIDPSRPVPDIHRFSTNFSILNNIIGSDLNSRLTGPIPIINALLPYVLTFAGLILFAMLIMGGFQMMTAGNDAKKADAGKARVTAAIAGFVIVFAAYWITQILEIILGIKILSV